MYQLKTWTLKTDCLGSVPDLPSTDYMTFNLPVSQFFCLGNGDNNGTYFQGLL